MPALRPRLQATAFVLGLTLLPALARAQSNPIQDEWAAAEAAAHDYVRLGDYGDLEAGRRAFHPSARLQFVREGAYTQLSLEEYLGRVRPPAPGTTPPPPTRQTRVTLLDLAGTAAVARVEILTGENKITDYLSLLKVDGRWQITNKIFDNSRR